jgi:Skp family chaperone for outer membrane proteins
MKHRQVRLLLIAATIAAQALWAATSTPASAQQQPVPVVVGVVNADTVVQESKAGRSLKAQADQQQKAIKADYDKQQKLFDDAARKLAAQKDSLSAEDLRNKKEDLAQQAAQATKALNDRQRVLDRNVAKSQEQIVQALVDAVKDVAKAHGMTLVISKSVTPYLDPSYDISPEVMQKVNAKLPSVKLQQASDAQ